MLRRPVPGRPSGIPPGGVRRLLRPVTRRGRIIRAAAVLLAVLAILTAAAEAAAGHVLNSRITDSTAKALGTRMTADTGNGPALLKILDRRLDRVTLTGGNARIGNLTGASIKITLDDVRFQDSAPTVAGVRADVTVPADALADMIRDSGGRIPVSGARTDPANGTLLLDLGSGGTGLLTLKPALTDGRVTITATELTFLGRTVTGPRLDQINDRLTAKGKPAAYPLSLKPAGLTVTPRGLALTLTTGPTTLKRT